MWCDATSTKPLPLIDPHRRNVIVPVLTPSNGQARCEGDMMWLPLRAMQSTQSPSEYTTNSNSSPRHLGSSPRHGSWRQSGDFGEKVERDAVNARGSKSHQSSQQPSSTVCDGPSVSFPNMLPMTALQPTNCSLLVSEGQHHTTPHPLQRSPQTSSHYKSARHRDTETLLSSSNCNKSVAMQRCDDIHERERCY